MEKATYDAVVIGGGISGLSIAGLLGKAGRKVVVLERDSLLGGKSKSIEVDGFTLDMGPHVFQEKGFQYEIFELLGKDEELKKIRVPFVEGDIKLATYRDGKWINFYELIPTGPEMEKVGKAIAAVKPKDIPKYDAISVADWIKGITADEDIIFFINFFASMMCTHPDPNYIAAGIFIRMLQLPQYAPEAGGLITYYARGGMKSWIKLLEVGCKENGVGIRTNSDVTKILVEDGRVKGVLVEEGDRRKQVRFAGFGEIGEVKRIEAPIVVTSFPVWKLFHIISRDYFPTWFVEWLDGSRNRVTSDVGFWVASREPIFKEKWFVLTRSPRTKLPIVVLPLSNVSPEVAPEGISLLCEVSMVDPRIRGDREQVYKTIELLKEDMDDLYPGWRDKVIWIRPYFFGVEQLSHMPTHFGVFRPGPKAPMIEGLYFTGESVITGLPTREGVCESAIKCAEEILGEPVR